jgi:hypothetical protein
MAALPVFPTDFSESARKDRFKPWEEPPRRVWSSPSGLGRSAGLISVVEKARLKPGS